MSRVHKTTVRRCLIRAKCENLTLKAKHQVQTFASKVVTKMLRRIKMQGEKNTFIGCLWFMSRNIVLHSSPNIVRVIKSRIMRWAGQVACMGRGEGGV